MRIKQHLIILGLIIVFPFDVYSHTVVEGKCDDATIYEYNSETTQNNESILLDTDNYILTLQHRSDVWDIHDLKIAPKTNPDQTALFQFEGPVFEIITLELDNIALGKEFMVIDKPSARGYRYSLIPSPQEKTTNPNLHFWALWSLPEHDYPMFTDLNNDQVCEILTFDEDYVIAFKYPSFMVTSNAYQFEAISGQLSLNSALTHQHIQSQWEDELYQYNRIMNSIGNAKRKEDIHLQMYEFELETISATRFLYTAKQVGEFPEAIAK